MSPKPKLTNSQIGEVRKLKADDQSLTNDALGARFGVNASTISRALADTSAWAPAQLPLGNSTMVELDLALLAPSPLNPRRTFNDESIAALAETIAEKGLLQNLMVRKPKESGYVAITDGAGGDHAGFYDIVFGERRLRALQLLAKQGRWDKTVSCIIADIDDATHIALALLENVQREDVPALEEADGIARLHAMDPETYSTQAIADRLGRTQRYVQGRIAISSNLVAPAKLLLGAHLINIECGRLFAAESHAVQMEILNDWELDEIDETTNLEGLEEQMIEPITPSSVQDAIKYIHVRQENEKAAAARAAAPPPQAEMRLDSASASEPRDRTESPVKVTPPPAKPETESGPSVTKSHIFHAHRRKTIAMRAALAGDHTNALRVACLALLGPQGIVTMRASRAENDEDPEYHGLSNKQIDATVKRILDGVKTPDYHGDGKAIKLWAHLQKISARDLEYLFSALVARQLHTPARRSAMLGDDPLAEAIAKTLDLPGNEANHGLALHADDLAGLRKPLLLAIADETGTPAVNDSTKIGDLTDAIKKKRKRDDYVLPTLRFGSTKQLEKALAEVGK